MDNKKKLEKITYLFKATELGLKSYSQVSYLDILTQALYSQPWYLSCGHIVFGLRQMELQSPSAMWA